MPGSVCSMICGGSDIGYVLMKFIKNFIGCTIFIPFLSFLLTVSLENLQVDRFYPGKTSLVLVFYTGHVI